MLKGTQTRPVLGRKETRGRIWMPRMNNIKGKMVSFLSCCWQSVFVSDGPLQCTSFSFVPIVGWMLYNFKYFCIISWIECDCPSWKEAQSGAHVEHWPCARPVHVWQWVERRRGTVPCCSSQAILCWTEMHYTFRKDLLWLYCMPQVFIQLDHFSFFSLPVTCFRLLRFSVIDTSWCFLFTYRKSMDMFIWLNWIDGVSPG